MYIVPYLCYSVRIFPIKLGFPVNGFPSPQSTHSMIGIFACCPLEARYVLFGFTMSIIGHLAYLISFLCSRRYLAASFHASSISSCCRRRRRRRRRISCYLLAISCCMASLSLFLRAYSNSSIAFGVPHFPSSSVHSGYFAVVSCLLSGYVSTSSWPSVF